MGRLNDVRTFPDASPGYAAARLALLIARASVAERGGVPPARFCLLPDETPADVDGVARLLAAQPKPLVLRSEARDGCIAITATSLSSEPDRLAMHEARRGHGGAERTFSFLPRPPRADRDDRVVACRGAGGELIRVTVDEFEDCRRDYHIAGPHGFGADRARSSYRRAQGFTREDVKGAAAIVSFGGGPDRIRTYSVEELRGASPALTCAACSVRPAELKVREGGTDGPRERDLCRPCWEAEQRAMQRAALGPPSRIALRASVAVITLLAIVAAVAGLAWSLLHHRAT